MGNFFHSEYNLYAEVVGNPGGVAKSIFNAVRAVSGRDDFEEDIADACEEIGSSRSFEDTYSSLRFLMGLLDQTIGVAEHAEG